MTYLLKINADALYVLLIGFIKFVINENEVCEVAWRFAENINEPFIYFKVHLFDSNVVLSYELQIYEPYLFLVLNYEGSFM